LFSRTLAAKETGWRLPCYSGGARGRTFGGTLVVHVFAFVGPCAEDSLCRSPPPSKERLQLLDRAQRALDNEMACCSELDRLVAASRLNASSPQIRAWVEAGVISFQSYTRVEQAELMRQRVPILFSRLPMLICEAAVLTEARAQGRRRDHEFPRCWQWAPQSRAHHMMSTCHRRTHSLAATPTKRADPHIMFVHASGRKGGMGCEEPQNRQAVSAAPM
jgi:hypothetical protein